MGQCRLSSDTVFEDPYLGATQNCKIAYVGQKPFENLIIKVQGRKMHEASKSESGFSAVPVTRVERVQQDLKNLINLIKVL